MEKMENEKKRIRRERETKGKGEKWEEIKEAKKKEGNDIEK